MLKNYRAKILIMIVLIGFLSFLSLNRWPNDFDRKIHCIYYKLGENTYENVEVHLVGSINRSLLLEDYISYTLYIDGVRYPEKNHLLMPFNKRKIGSFPVYKTDFNPVNEIQTTYYQYKLNNALYIKYRYWKESLDFANQRYLDFGVLFFNEISFDEIIIGINDVDNNGTYHWTNKVGYEVIVSGNNLEEAKVTLKELNMKVFDENNKVVD